MPPVSEKQNRAMQAAAHGSGKLGIPVSVAQEFTGDAPPRKKTKRGRKPSGKPGSEHIAALQKAHGAGDFKAAKTAALNYAKAAHAHVGTNDSTVAPTNSPPMVETDFGADTATPPGQSDIAPAKPDRRAALAKIAMSRKK